MRPGILVVATLYLVGVLAITVWAARRTRTTDDFFVAGRRLGPLVAGLATASAAFSGFVFIGGPGLAYRMGLGSLFVVVPLSFTSALLCWAVGRRLVQLAADHEVRTIPDALAVRYDSRFVSGLAAIALVVGVLAYLGVQLQALSLVLEALLPSTQLLGVPLGPALALGVLLLYATSGGMLAGAYTDVLQGALMVAAAVAVALAAVAAVGGPAALVTTLATSSPELLDPLAGAPWLTAICFFFVFSIGPLGQPHMLHKFYMVRDEASLRHLPLVIAVVQSLSLLVWLGIGLAVPALVAQGRIAPLTNPDEATTTFLLAVGPDLLTGLLFAGALAAIMSTADSFLNIGAAALVRDLPRALGRPLSNELLWARLAVLGIGLGASGVALAWGDLVALLGTFAFGTFAAALAPVFTVGLHWPRVGPRAALASIAVGLGGSIGLELGTRAGLVALPGGVLPSAVALAAAFATLFAVALALPESS